MSVSLMLPTLKKTIARLRDLVTFRFDDITVEREYLPGMERENRLAGLGT